MAEKTQKPVSSIIAIESSRIAIGTTVLAPLGRVKLLLQGQHEIIQTGRLDKPYKGVMDCLKITVRNEGVLQLWRGNVASCGLRVSSTMLSITVMEQLLRKGIKPNPRDSSLRKLTTNFTSGALAGVVTQCLVYSLNFTRTRLANDIKINPKFGPERQFSGIVDVYKQILKSDGVHGLYRGFSASCLGIGVYTGCYWGFYETLKPLLLTEKSQYIARYTLATGVTLAAGLIAYPLDTIQVRMAMRSGEPLKYSGVVDCGRRVLACQGLAGLMNGFQVNIIRALLSAGFLVAYDIGINRYSSSRSKAS